MIYIVSPQSLILYCSYLIWVLSSLIITTFSFLSSKREWLLPARWRSGSLWPRCFEAPSPPELTSFPAMTVSCGPVEPLVAAAGCAEGGRAVTLSARYVRTRLPEWISLYSAGGTEVAGGQRWVSERLRAEKLVLCRRSLVPVKRLKSNHRYVSLWEERHARLCWEICHFGVAPRKGNISRYGSQELKQISE